MVSDLEHILSSLPLTSQRDSIVKQMLTGTSPSGDKTKADFHSHSHSHSHSYSDSNSDPRSGSHDQKTADSNSQVINVDSVVVQQLNFRIQAKTDSIQKAHQQGSVSSCDDNCQITDLLLPDQPGTGEKKPSNTGAGGGFLFCTAVQNKNGHFLVPGTLNKLLFQHGISIKDTPDNLKKLMQKVHHAITEQNCKMAGTELSASTVFKSVRQEEICWCEKIFDIADIFLRNIEMLLKRYSKMQILILKTEQLLRLLYLYLKSQSSLYLAHLQMLAFHLDLRRVHQKKIIIKQIKVITHEFKHLFSMLITRDRL